MTQRDDDRDPLSPGRIHDIRILQTHRWTNPSDGSRSDGRQRSVTVTSSDLVPISCDGSNCTTRDADLKQQPLARVIGQS